MPRIRLTAAQLAVARGLAAQEWTHERIGTLFGVNRSTVSYALSRRKSILPTRAEELTARTVEAVNRRIEAAVRQALAGELRTLASELEAGSDLSALNSQLLTRAQPVEL